MFRSLRWSLLSTGLAGVLAAVCVLLQALSNFQQLDQAAEAAMNGKDLVADVLPPPMYLIELRLVLSQAIEGTLPVPRAQARAEALATEYAQRARHWHGRLPADIDGALLGQQGPGADAFLQAARAEVLQPLARGDTAAARAGLARADRLYQQHREQVDATVRLAAGYADSRLAAFDATRRSGSRTMIGMTVLMALLAAGCYLGARRGILRPLAQCTEQAHRVAAGDLSREVRVTRRDEFGLLQSSLGGMTDRLATMLGDLRHGIQAIHGASVEIAQGNHDLSDRNERQAGRLQQAAASMEEMAATVRANVGRARDASTLAQGAAEVAVQAGDAVERVVHTMGDIRESSRRIADITGVIDGLAFQTNILALNAAVEAARAGEQGRGFAVVAGEVRTLAQRSAAASREIKALIDASVHSAQAGHERVGEAGQTMREVVSRVNGMATLVAAIAESSAQQDEGVQQMAGTVVDLDAATQHNAALVQQTAAAASSLQAQADRLAQAVTVFQLQPA
ncbi:methyl-accepting chemotaxis protein [Aquincola tertiaricarbonis]|uniref:methyl-accepting chemotaxis protein n=1 Tax=Aquincola tertiaricarbonis TaxID=391953 RepID=UPI0006154110|nr:methyl-accepting chemotaxis protein [Aquincola tertiaricarbonis]